MVGFGWMGGFGRRGVCVRSEAGVVCLRVQVHRFENFVPRWMHKLGVVEVSFVVGVCCWAWWVLCFLEVLS